MSLVQDPGEALEALVLPKAATPNVTDLFSGLTGLSSIAGGFDHAYVDAADEEDAVSASLGNVTAITANLFLSKMTNQIECGHFTKVGTKHHFTVDVAGECRFWTEGVLSSIVAAFGLIGNIVSIWVLSVPEMRNSFNRLLLALAIIDSMFILPGILIYTSKAFNWRTDWYNYAFPVFLYPFSEIALCSSIYMTVAIAVERYIGLCRPLKRLSNGRGPCAAKAYIVPVLVMAVALNVPKFFESETREVRSSYLTNSTTTKVKISALRTDPHYITYYWMWTRLLATGIIPLVVLALLNSKIYMSIRQSKQQLRILAIRSALPMAILGQSAPSVPPLSELLCQSGGCSNTNGTNGTAEDGSNGGGVSRPTSGQGKCPNGCHNKKRAVLTMQNHVDLDDDMIRKVPESPKTMSATNGSGKGTTTNGRLVNGRLRQIQRSVSAFVSSSTSSSTSNAEIKSAKMLRSNSSTASTTVNTNWDPPPATGNGGGGGGSSGGADMKLAPILFGVVIVFVICNCLRVTLNVYDFTVVEDIIQCEKKGVGRVPPAWIVCSISVSHLLLMVNSSVNFLVYCVAGTRFRRVLMRKLRVLVKSLCCGKLRIANSPTRNQHLRDLQARRVDRMRSLEQQRRMNMKFNDRAQEPDILEEEDENGEDNDEAEVLVSNGRGRDRHNFA